MFAIGHAIYKFFATPAPPTPVNSNGKRHASEEVIESRTKTKVEHNESDSAEAALELPTPPTEEETDPDEIAPLPPVRAGITAPSLKNLTEAYADGSTEVEAEESNFEVNEKLNSKVAIWRGDITKLGVDAIVNAANKACVGGGGVDGAIHSAAGSGLYDECVLLNGCDTGSAKITGGHDLPATHIIHTVGPIYRLQKKAESEKLLRSCYTSTLALAVENGCKSIAFSGISTGVYGYPLDAATKVALAVVREFLESSEGEKVDNIIFTVFRQIDVDSYNSIISAYFPPALGLSKDGAVDSEEASVEVEEKQAVVVEE